MKVENGDIVVNEEGVEYEVVKFGMMGYITASIPYVELKKDKTLYRVIISDDGEIPGFERKEG